MKNAKMTALRFDNNDVIATSSLLTITNTLNGTLNDATYTIKIDDNPATTYSSATLSEDTFNAAFGAGMYRNGVLQKVAGKDDFGYSVRILVNYDTQKNNDYGDSSSSKSGKYTNAYNNTYVFINGKFYISQ